MKAVYSLLFACACAFATPFVSNDASQDSVPSVGVPPWPDTFEGKPLREIALSERERGFLANFPGAVARFTDGERDIVMRWVLQPTRRLHPAEDCYRGLGYEPAESRIVADRDGAPWRCFTARRTDGERVVCEHIRDGADQRWTDVSSWYWAATLKRSQSPWLITTIAETVDRG
jgi:hypothetical protein